MRTFFICLLLFSLHILLKVALADSTNAEQAAIAAPQRQQTSFGEILALDVVGEWQKLPYGDNALQFGELWMPNADTGKPPLFIFVHGGCWLNQYGVDHSRGFASALRQAGYAVWAIEYRRSGDQDGGWPGSLNDVVAGIEYALTEFAELIDTQQVTLSGHSAGGHLALLAANQEHLKNKLWRTFGLAAITDPGEYSKGQNSCQQATIAFMGGTAQALPQLYQAAKINKLG